MKRSFVVLGGSGDLTGRLLLPSLAELYERGVLDEAVEVLAVSQQDWDNEAYRDWARQRLTAHAAGLAEDARERVVAQLGHEHGDVTDPDDLRELAALVEEAGGRRWSERAAEDELRLAGGILHELAQVGVATERLASIGQLIVARET